LIILFHIGSITMAALEVDNFGKIRMRLVSIVVMEYVDGDKFAGKTDSKQRNDKNGIIRSFGGPSNAAR
jgi:hypothetical protein